MQHAPVLVVGGSGVVGRPTLRWFRDRHPDVPLLVGGRNALTAHDTAQEVDAATAVQVDADVPGLGLDESSNISAVVLLAPDDGLHALRLAQNRGVPYVTISTGLPEVGAEMAHFVNRPAAAPIVLAGHWWGGAAVFLALRAAKDFETVRSVHVSAVLDEQDPAGPAALGDMERLQEAVPATLAFRGGHRTWLSGEAAASRVGAVDGRQLSGRAYSPFDVIGLHAATGAQDVRFDLAAGISSSRARGDSIAAELVVDIEGTRRRRAGRSRSTLEFCHGQASLTGLGVVLTLSAVLGLDGNPEAEPGLYLPEQLTGADWFLAQLTDAGADVRLDC